MVDKKQIIVFGFSQAKIFQSVGKPEWYFYKNKKTKILEIEIFARRAILDKYPPPPSFFFLNGFKQILRMTILTEKITEYR